MPLGEFTINPDRDACILAGGTGVTAFSAFLAGLPAAYPHHIHLFYGARRPGQLIYRALVEAAAQRCPGLQVSYFAEQDFEGTDCLQGLIKVETVFGTVPEPLSLAYYLAGPPEMIQTLTLALTQRGLPNGQVIAEAWE
jgi:ferredoxin-NADP reductase